MRPHSLGQGLCGSAAAVPESAPNAVPSSSSRPASIRDHWAVGRRPGGTGLPWSPTAAASLRRVLPELLPVVRRPIQHPPASKPPGPTRSMPSARARSTSCWASCCVSICSGMGEIVSVTAGPSRQASSPCQDQLHRLSDSPGPGGRPSRADGQIVLISRRWAPALPAERERVAECGERAQRGHQAAARCCCCAVAGSRPWTGHMFVVRLVQRLDRQRLTLPSHHPAALTG
jgi:hypothetical protein